MKTTEVPPHTCTQCGDLNDAASHTDQMPQEGNISVCWNCGLLTVFNKDLTQRKPTAEELAEWKTHPAEWAQVKRTQDFVLGRGRLR